jgi:fido (protein-threonine AMPylation protein)
MDLFAKYQDEQHAVYQQLESANTVRYYGFLTSMIESAIASDQLWVTEPLVKAINFHAIVGLYPNAGVYRTEPVFVGNYTPPEFHEVEPLMGNAVTALNSNWQSSSASVLAAFALWVINNIHPFVNGNGRTARAVCYFILCVKSGGLLPGTTILPEMLGKPPIRPNYVAALKEADNSNLEPLVTIVRGLITQQLQS